MPTPKLQTSRALNIIPSDTVPIPNPFKMVSGDADGSLTNFLIDTTKDFVALGIHTGDIVYNLSILTSTTVSSEPLSSNPTKLELTDDIMTSGDKYIIYQNSPLSGEPNAGCVLYVGTGGDLTVVTAGGDLVTFLSVPTGVFIPVNVLYVYSSGTNADNFVALW